MKKNIAKYMLDIYLNFIVEDWEIYNKWIVPFIKPAWFVRSTFIWILSFVLFPLFYYGMILGTNFDKVVNETIM